MSLTSSLTCLAKVYFLPGGHAYCRGRETESCCGVQVRQKPARPAESDQLASLPQKRAVNLVAPWWVSLNGSYFLELGNFSRRVRRRLLGCPVTRQTCSNQCVRRESYKVNTVPFNQLFSARLAALGAALYVKAVTDTYCRAGRGFDVQVVSAVC